MKNKFSIAMTLAVVLAMLVTSLALADTVTPDSDTITTGDQTTRDLGSVAPNAVLTPQVSFMLACAGNNHVDNPQSVSLTFTLAGSTVPSGGNLSASGATIGATSGGDLGVPTTWPDDGSNCASAGSPAPINDNGNSTVTITAPSVAGTYTYKVKYNATPTPAGLGDPSAITGSVIAEFTLTVVADSTPPVVTVPTDITTEATGPSGAAVSFTASANDLVDGAITPTCDHASGSTFPLSTTLVTCSATDAAGNTGSASFSVTVVDTTAPFISGTPSNITKEATSAAGATATYTSPTANDLVSGSVAVTCSPASGSTFALGTTTVNCSASDAAGNTASSSFTVTVVDTTAPTIAPHSNVGPIEATGPSGAAATYTSPTANDLVSGSVAVTCSPASGSTFALGTTTVNCSASDAAGNTASSSFTVTVVDTTPPTLTLPGPTTAEATGSSGAAATYAASASDLVSGSVAVNCSPASGSTFGLGATTVNCSASDAAGNIASGSFTVTVVDTTPPTVTVPANITAEATGPSGAAVTFTATASDLVDGVIAPTCSPLSGSTFALDATTTVTCSATDAHGNTGSASFSVSVVDTTAPSVTVPANITTGPTGPLGANVTYSGASASDLVDGSVAVSCSPASGSLFVFGPTTVTCTATDAHGNSGSANFSVTVTGFNFLGFFQPVDNSMLNTVKNGSTVPVKWKLQGEGGIEITSTAAVTSIRARQLSCASFVGLTEDTIETLTSGNSILRYDSTAMQFVYNWQTYRQPNTCWQLIVSFTDGTSKSANFKLK